MRYSIKLLYRELCEEVKVTPSIGDNKSYSSEHNSCVNNRPKVNLPRIDLPKFDGKIGKWPTFYSLFTVLIDKNPNISDIEKFQYLLASLSKEALRLIKNLPLVDTNYRIALNKLVKTYHHVLLTNYWQAVVNAPKDDGKSADSLRNLLLIFSEALEQVEELDMWNFTKFNLLLHKINSRVKGQFQAEFNNERYPTYEKLYEFLEGQYQAMERSSMTDSEVSKPNEKLKLLKSDVKRNPSPPMRTRPVASFVTKTQNNRTCVCCKQKQDHSLIKCDKFLELDPNERHEIVKRERFCFNCLSNNHPVTRCGSNYMCRVCNGRHHTLLHFKPENASVLSNVGTPRKEMPAVSPNSKAAEEKVHALTSIMSVQNTVLLATARVRIRDGRNNYQECRALLDGGSQASFITAKCASKLGLKRSSSIAIQGLNDMCTTANLGTVQCEVSSCYELSSKLKLEMIVIPEVCTQVPTIPVNIYQWNHLKGLRLADRQCSEPSQIDILLVADIFAQVLTPGVKRGGGGGEPCAINTVFGWVLMGKVNCLTETSNIKSFHTLVDLNSSLKRFWELEEVPKYTPQCPDDIVGEEKFKITHSRDESGRYIVHLPFREPIPQLGESYSIALRRFLALEVRLKRETAVYEQYSNFMKDYLDQGHMSEVSTTIRASSCYYIPHHCVLKPHSSTTKLRVVFDASAKSSTGVSLNDTQLVGPKLQSDIVSLLLMFRVHNIVFTADIKQMYRQILVVDDHRDFQRILWRFDPTDSVKEYRLNTVTYGVSSSPYLAIRTLHQLAQDYGTKYPLASKVLNSATYVDDIVSGAETASEACAIRLQLVDLLAEAGFELRKWSSNHPDLLSSVPIEHQLPRTFDGDDPGVKVLGLQWCASSDSFTYAVKPISRECTKRNILSELARIYDPLGFLAPLTLFAKQLIQQLWTLGLGWDDEPPPEVCQRWATYKSQLPEIAAVVKIPRQLILSNVVKVELHGFCDASERGYGAVVYFRYITRDDQVHVSLVCGKSKVSPLKQVSLPRLELCGAVLLSDLMEFVITLYKDQIKVDELCAWSDSTVVLSWIQSSSHKWKCFVANRVTHIQERVAPNYWRHVSGGQNPADCASRGLLPSELAHHALWWAGPDWFREPRSLWPVGAIMEDFTSSQLELKVNKIVCAAGFLSSDWIYDLLNKHSSLRKIQGVVAYCQRFVNNVKVTRDKWETGPLCAMDLHKALLVIVRVVQQDVFASEIRSLQLSELCSKAIRKLNPFLDGQTIIRVGGRLEHSDLPYDAKHPVLLPRTHRLTSLIIEDMHRKHLHPGPRTLQNLLLQQFWILSSRRAINQILSKCYRCFRAKPVPLAPPMGDLPKVRVSQVKPFSHVGIDFAGPFLVTMGRYRGSKSSKSYQCVLVCFATKAIHLELVSSLSAEACLAALRRFVARRGRCNNIYSDCGTNFIGANNLLLSYWKEAAASLAIKWTFNPPSAPHFGGLWEAGVKSVKFHLRRVIGQQILTYEELLTVFTQIEAVLNSRPLCEVLVEYDDVEWHRREWISVYRDGLFHLFMVEQGLCWAERKDPYSPVPHSSTSLWPALTFTPLVSTLENPLQFNPVEFLLDKELAFKHYETLTPFKEWDSKLPGVRDYPELKAAVRRWAEQQDGQKIFVTTPSVLLGYRVEVYRAQGTTQWYSAVIVGYNEATRDLTVTSDSVLEEHNEDPSLVQMRLIGDGVVESIMRGEDVGITPRRSRSALLQTQHQKQTGRIFRGISSSNVNTRKLRATCKSVTLPAAVSGLSQESADKDYVTKAVRKRKASENDTSSSKLRNNQNAKEDLENKQQNGRKKSATRKKVLEEANNSKLRDVQVLVEDCLQNPASLILYSRSPLREEVVAAEEDYAASTDVDNISNASSVELVVPVTEVQSDDERVCIDKVPDVSESRVVVSDLLNNSNSNNNNSAIEEEEDDCVIVAQRTPLSVTSRTDERGDDDGPLSSSSPFNRMELSESANVALSLRFPDDRSDSGVSSLRSGSGDERSGSRSSALSSSDEPQHSAVSTVPANAQPPIFIPVSQSYTAASGINPSEPVRVWRDPSLLLESEPHVRHIQSVQHQSLLMSHPSTPASAGPPPTSAATAGHQGAVLYPPVPPPPTLMSPHPLSHHPHLPPGLYPHHPLSETLWKQRYPLPVIPAHLLTQQATHPSPEERVYAAQDRDRHERLYRQNQEVRELEKQQHQKERERIERERQERDKLEKEREREKQEREREQERERKEKQKAVQSVNQHFEESLRRANQKRENSWNLVSLPPPHRSSNSEEERKRAEQELHQREQQRHALSRSQDVRDNRAFYTTASQRPPSAPSKTEYPPPAHSSRIATSKASTEKLSMQSNHLNMYGYPAYQPTAFYTHEPKNKSEHHKQAQAGSLIVTKSGASIERERESLPNPPPLMSEIKSSVIVKHDGKNQHLLEPRVSVAHSQSPKLRTPEMMGHYFSASGQQQKANVYEYRSPTQSPHHLAHAPSPHHHLETQNMNKVSSHHRSSGQIPSPHHQRQSPHQHVSPEVRYRSNSESQAMIFPTSSGKVSYPFSIASTTTMAHYTLSPSSVSNSKPKVSSPAPHHIYGKPSPGIGSGIPITRTVEGGVVSNPIPLTSKPPLTASVSPSPYQQVSQYHPPHPQVTPIANCLPPPAHSSRTSIDRVNMYERGYPGGSVPGGLSVKPSSQLGTSPPTAASAPSPISRPHPQYIPVTHPSQNMVSVQTQPLDLGMSSTKYDSASSPKRKGTPVSSANNSGGPVCLEIKKRRIEQSPSPQQVIPVYSGSTPPQLARVSEPSPLIASAATTITTVVNTAAYRPPTTLVVPQSQPALMESLPDVSVTTVPVSVEVQRVPSADGSSQQSTASSFAPPTSNSPPVTSNTIAQHRNTDSPNTPVKPIITPSVMDSEKSNSPGPAKSTNYPVRHLKKAWLQRHTGEDVEDTTGIIGSGSCVTLPLNINSSSTNSTAINKEVANTVTSYNIGSMAINSINKTKHFSSKTNNRKVSHKESTTLNGHPADLTKGDDSSSSDQERGRKSPPKRKPPKVKRKKGGGPPKKVPEDKRRKAGSQSAAASESGSDSDKETGSEKDSDSGASTTPSINKKNNGNASNTAKDKEPRKRGRRPKTSKNDKGEEPRPKKSKEEVLPQRDPFRKPPVGQLKKTGESFLQDGPCFEVAPKLGKCRECRWTPNQRTKNMPNIFCRFYAFRRLRYTKNGQLAIAGFSDPHKDALEDDLSLWLPSTEVPPSDLDLETSRFLLKQVGDHFCDLLVQEKEACAEHMSEEKTIAWKRVVQGVREMCDVCETTLFNFHWACKKCGFVVCLDCYKSRKNGTVKVWGEAGKDRDDFSWLLCTNRVAHEQEKLMLTQIIADDSLMKLGKMVHEVRDLWNIEQYCACPMSKEKSNVNGASKEIIKSILMDKVNGIKKEIKEESDTKPIVNGLGTKDEKTSLNWLADVALSNESKKNEDSSSDSDEGGHSTLRELLIRPSHKPNGSRAASPGPSSTTKAKKTANSRMDTLDEVISSVIEDSVPKNSDSLNVKSELKHFVRRYNWQAKGRSPLPIRIMTLTESKILYPDTPHSWLCDGKLLRLIDPSHQGNTKIFQDQWKRGQPVIVSDVTRFLDKDLWNPDAFARDFGEEKNDLVNCMTGNLVPNQPMRKFWEGFDHFSKRLKDDRGNPMLLKLKDWPPGEDFAEMLPTRFSDLMKVLPLSDYTHRTGRLNLASRLPDCFVRPDLGPKMYNAYGSALHPSKGTTNLHLDISDAVNVMVYVGIPKDGDNDEHIKEAFRAIDEAGCDILTRRRVRDKGELPGALWHIYNARDADKIRDLLNKVVVEKGGRLEPHHDPIHDQSCYLDGPLRERLYKEYGVEGYAIVQCLGDAVFIPAGAPHQVRNLHNCIKVAEDFVSPENVSHCFHLTQEFRDLSDTHSNHEDKLQIKNIIYHAVKDSLSSLSAILDRHSVKSEKERNGGSVKDNSNNQQTPQQQNSNLDSSSEPA